MLPQILSVDRTYKLSMVGIYAGARPVGRGPHGLGRAGVARPDRVLRRSGRRSAPRRPSTGTSTSASRSSSASSWEEWSRRSSGCLRCRRRGFYLAVATLAFSLATTSYFLNKRYFGWVPDGRIARPPLFGRIDITSTASFYYVVYAVLAASLFIVKGIRDSRTGRAFMALRDNERAAEAYGLHATRVRLLAFALSGALAGSGRLPVGASASKASIPTRSRRSRTC